MTGNQFKEWVVRTGIKPEQIAVDLDVSLAAIYKWYKAPEVSRVVCLALLQKYGRKLGPHKKDPN